MSLLSTTWLYLILFIHTAYCQYDSDNETWWVSTGDIQTELAKPLGTIRIGTEMQMEFDFEWHGRTDPDNVYEPFFRIGASAVENGAGCGGENDRYPSM